MNSILEQNSVYYNQACFTQKGKKSSESFTNDAQQSFASLLEHTEPTQQEDRKESSNSPSVEEAKKCIMNYRAALVQEILYGNSNEEAKAKKRAKKYRLFQADNGVFGNKTLADLVNYNQENDKTVTWNSSESKKLTKEQALYLKKIFHVTNLSGEDFGGLLEELIDSHMLSRQEAEKLLAQIPKNLESLAEVQDEERTT